MQYFLIGDRQTFFAHVVIDTDNRLEVAIAGREGMLGSSLVLGIDKPPLLALVQGAGTALRIDAGSNSPSDAKPDSLSAWRHQGAGSAKFNLSLLRVL